MQYKIYISVYINRRQYNFVILNRVCVVQMCIFIFHSVSLNMYIISALNSEYSIVDLSPNPTETSQEGYSGLEDAKALFRYRELNCEQNSKTHSQFYIECYDRCCFFSVEQYRYGIDGAKEMKV